MTGAPPTTAVPHPEVRKDALQSLMAPDSIVIVGASGDANKVNGRPLFNLVRDGFPGRVYPVNPKYAEIAGLRCFPDLESLPEVPDLGVVLVAAERAGEVVARLGNMGVKVAIVCGSGFGETGEAGKRLEAALLATAKAHAIRLCGPNNLGLVNAFLKMPLTFSQYADTPVHPGPVGFVSQSGAFGTAVATAARSRGIGLGYFVSTGNQADIDTVEVLDRMLDDPRIRVVVAYMEGLSRGERLVRAAAKAMHLGKPLILVKVGRHAAGTRAVISHTGALAGDDAVFDGIIRQHGILRARNEMHALDLAAAFVACPPAMGAGLGLVTISGGAGVMMADLAEDRELEVPVLADATQARLKKVLHGFASVGNPVDVTGQVIEDASTLRASLEIVADDPTVSVCIVWMQLLHKRAEVLCDSLIAYRHASHKPFIVCWLNAPDGAFEKLRAAGVCVVGATESAIDVAAGLAQYARARQRALERDALPPLQPPSIVSLARQRESVPSIEAARMLQAAGLTLVGTRLAATPLDTATCAEELGYPVALKIESGDIAHKTEAGGVVLGISDRRALLAAAEKMLANVRRLRPNARIDGLLVQKMAEPGGELVLGIRRDPTFGPIVMIGLGGIFVEVLKDVAFACPPICAGDALAMIASLRGRAVLDGVRGLPPADKDVLVRAILGLASFARSHPEVVELDMNPVFAGPHGTVAVDWLMVRER